MRQKVILILGFVMLAGLCSCGVRLQDKNEETEKAAVVEDQAIASAPFKNSETTVKENRLINDYIQIWLNDTEEKWMQSNLDGSGTKTIDSSMHFDGDGLEEILWLTNDWIYYTMPTETGGIDGLYFDIYRCPFDHAAQPMYDFYNDRELLVKNIAYVTYSETLITESYLFYLSSSTDDQYKGYKYDFETQKISDVFDLDEIMVIVHDSTYLPVTIEDKFFLAGHSGIDSVSLGTLEKKNIYSGSTIDEDMEVAEWDGNLYFTTCGTDEDGIYKYDGKQSISVVTEKSLWKAVDAMHLFGDIDADPAYYIMDCNIINGRFYIWISAEWTMKERYIEGPYKGEYDEQAHDIDAIISADINDLSNWRVEEDLLEFMKKDSDSFDPCIEHEEEWKTDGDHTGLPDGGIRFLYDTQIGFDTGNNKRFYLYDITTGEIRKLDKKVFDMYYSWSLIGRTN